MGRSKSQPTKKKPRIEEDEAAAIDLLKSIPQEQVEKAAADATRLDVKQHWPVLLLREQERDCGNGSDDGDNDQSNRNIIYNVPAWARGLGPPQKLDDSAFAALQNLHNKITLLSEKSSWSGSPSDPRQRAFGFLPDTLGYNPSIREKLDISMPWRAAKEDQDLSNGSTVFTSNASAGTQKEEEEERNRNKKAMVILGEVPEGTKDAIEHVCGIFRQVLMSSAETKSLAEFLCYENLIAAQPNLHNGRELLPMHFDHPLKDGFGVVIVTISITGSSKILLQQDTAGQLAMPLQAGEAYMLADQARDACVHGVLTDVGQDHRESLNLRFGLHDVPIDGSSDVIVSASDVLKRWDAPSTSS